ncbi:MAG TPA: hypothetical protein VMY37_22675 [Thermoguttaceae bacterium]|nr:hypothetical protein [Thermoguttaceae bacterium]HUW59387.1 hypothetical protein [Candidatus Bathyarchaeia archaeon]
MNTLFPIVTFDLIDNEEADARLVQWGHYLGACNRPFGRQSFGLRVYGELVSVAVSASTPNKKCATFARQEVVELARLCTQPERNDLTLVCLRLWRQVAAETWLDADFKGWESIRAYVAYQNAVRHSGEIYKHDRWRFAKAVPGGRSGPNATWTRNREYDPKNIWVYDLPRPTVPG